MIGVIFFTKIVMNHLSVVIVTKVVFLNRQQMDHLPNHISTQIKII